MPAHSSCGALAAIDHLENHPELVTRLRENTAYFREGLEALGYKPIPGETPIVPVIIGETADAIALSRQLLDEGVFVIGFGFPVVPRGEARIRCQVSAAHTRGHLDTALGALEKVGRRLKLI
jgi:glycine C-acetyltransferase